jgi:hypothetical protein
MFTPRTNENDLHQRIDSLRMMSRSTAAVAADAAAMAIVTKQAAEV